MSSDTRTSPPAEAPPSDALDQGRFPPGAIVAGRYRVVALLYPTTGSAPFWSSRDGREA